MSQIVHVFLDGDGSTPARTFLVETDDPIEAEAAAMARVRDTIFASANQDPTTDYHEQLDAEGGPL